MYISDYIILYNIILYYIILYYIIGVADVAGFSLGGQVYGYPKDQIRLNFRIRSLG